MKLEAIELGNVRMSSALSASPTADEAMVARIHQQAAADSDYDNDQDNWLDNAPEGEGPEL